MNRQHHGDRHTPVHGDSSLTIMLDEQDLACVERCCPWALRGAVLAFELDLHLELLDRHIPHVTPWDLIEHSDWPAIRRFEEDLWAFWKLHAHVWFEGIDALALALYRHATCLSRFAWTAGVIRLAIHRMRPSRLVTFEEPEGHGLEPPLGCNKMPVLFMLARGIAEQAGLAVHLIEQRAQPGRPRWADPMAAASGEKPDPIDANEMTRKRPVVMFSGSGGDLVRQLPLIEKIIAEGAFTPVQVYRTATERQLASIRESRHLAWHDSQLTHGAPAVTTFDFIDRARDAFQEACRQCPPELAGVFQNPYLRPHFDFVFGRYARTLAQHVLSWKHVFSQFRPDALVTNHGSPLSDVAVRMGIPGIVLPHGLSLTANPRAGTWMPGFHVGAISPEHQGRLVHLGVPAEMVHLTGDPRVDEILGHIDALSRRGFDQVRQDIRQRLGLGGRERVVLLATGRLAMHARAGQLPQIDWADTLRCMDRLTDVAARHGGWRWLIQPHPRFDHPRLYERFDRSVPEGLRLIRGSGFTLHELALAGDAVVIFNIVTSALIEASFLPRPAMVLEQSIRWSNPQDSGMRAWPHFTSVEELEAELQSIFSDEGKYQRRILQTHAALEEYLGGAPRRAIPSCIHLIADLAARHTAPRPDR